MRYLSFIILGLFSILSYGQSTSNEQVGGRLEAVQTDHANTPQENQKDINQELVNKKRAEQMKRLREHAMNAQNTQLSYPNRLRKLVLSHLSFDASNIVGNPKIDIEISTNGDGIINKIDVTQSSGNREWDAAVIKAFSLVGKIPPDDNGNIPQKLKFTLTPKQQ